MIPRLVLPLICGVLLAAQTPDLKTVMNLSDNQIQSLTAIQQQKAQALAPMVQGLQQRQQALQQMLDSNPDPAAVLRLVLEINAIGHQIQQTAAAFQQQAQNVLRPEQQAQLGPLAEVLKLHTAAQQAVGLGLLNAPN